MSLISGPRSSYFCQLIQVLFDPVNSLENWSSEYGDSFKLGGDRTPPKISFSSPEAIRDIFNAPSDSLGYVQKSDLMKSLLGDGSFLFLPESEHQRQRKLIAPCFHKQSLNSCGHNIIAITQRVMNNLPKNSFEVRPAMKKISLEVIVDAIFGQNNQSRRERITQILAELFHLFDSPLLALYLVIRSFMPLELEIEIGIWKSVRQLQRELDSLIDSEIGERRTQKNSSEKRDFLSLITIARNEEGQSMTDEEIRYAVITLIFGGFETAAAAMSWMLYRVHHTPNVREKLLNELNNSQNDDPLTISRLPYLNAVCNETLRINPVSLSAFSRTVKKPLRIAGNYLEPGTEIDVSIYLAHRRKSVYERPDEFKPKRFLEKQFSPYEFFPFGGGQCRCLGSALASFEMKLVLATIISNFELELLNPKPLKPKRHGIVLIPPELKMRII